MIYMRNSCWKSAGHTQCVWCVYIHICVCLCVCVDMVRHHWSHRTSFHSVPAHSHSNIFLHCSVLLMSSLPRRTLVWTSKVNRDRCVQILRCEFTRLEKPLRVCHGPFLASAGSDAEPEVYLSSISVDVGCCESKSSNEACTVYVSYYKCAPLVLCDDMLIWYTIGRGRYTYRPIRYYHDTWVPIRYVLWYFFIL